MKVYLMTENQKSFWQNRREGSMKHTPEIKTHGEATEIWIRNGLVLPELPLDESIFPNARELLRKETIGNDLLEACQEMVRAGTAFMEKEPNWEEKIDYADRLARMAIVQAERDKP